MSLTFGKTSFQVQRGLTWSETITVWQGKDGPAADLAGKTCLMQIRRKLPDADTVMELSEENGRLKIVDAAAGKIQLLVSADGTLEFPLSNFRKSLYVYDAVLITPEVDEDNPEVREPIVSGKVTVKHTVTRPWPSP